MSTADVLHHHLAAFGSGDTEEVLADYTEASVLITPQGTIKGLAGLREAFDGFFTGLFVPGTYTFTLDGESTEGDVAMIWWHATCEDAEIPFATDTLLVEDGKIAAQTFAAVINPR